MTTRIDPLVPQDDPTLAWIDRLGNIEFIDDQKLDNGVLQEAFYLAALRTSDRPPHCSFFVWLL